MFRNYLLVAFRHLNRNRVYSLINLFGLAAGLTCCILIFLFVREELSYDRFHTHEDRIFRIIEIIDAEGQGEESSSNPFPVGPTLLNDYPHLVETAVRLFNFQKPTLTLAVEDIKYNERQLFLADSGFFQVFDFQLIEGNPATALAQPNSIVVTQELARKYFGDESPMGKTIQFEGALDLLVTGVMAEIPAQTHFQFQGLISFASLSNIIGSSWQKNWIWNPCWTYLLLRDGIQPEELENQFPYFVNKYYPEFIKPQISHHLQTLGSIHLNSHLEYEIQPNGNQRDIWVLSAIGIFILLIASINFMNLSTARSAKRAREVGMRKVFGAVRGQLVLQFLSESLVMAFIAVFLALCLLEKSLPVFNELTGKTLDLNLLAQPWFLVGIVGLGLLVGVFSGCYPAFFLSSFRPVKVLKGGKESGLGARHLRRFLVVVQFAISAALIISTVVIYQQFRYLRSSDTGFNKEAVLLMPAKRSIVPQYDTFRNELKKHQGVLEVTQMNDIFGEDHNVHEYNYEGMEQGKWIYFPSLITDEHFVSTFEIEIIAGRNFSTSMAKEDSLSVLINESMVKNLGWESPEAALGKQFYTPSGRERVIGVMRDFNFVSLEQPIRPFVLDIAGERSRNFFMTYLAVRLRPENMAATIDYMEAVWAELAPQYPFDYFFLDERLGELYRSQDNLGKLVGCFAVLAILIACLGLFALASFTAEKRTREIGIRKVLGASEGSVIGLLARDFLKLVVVANLMAWPFVWYFLDQWLTGFAFHVELHPGIFFLTGGLILLIALLTVIFQAIKASRTDPVRALRVE